MYIASASSFALWAAIKPSSMPSCIMAFPSELSFFSHLSACESSFNWCEIPCPNDCFVNRLPATQPIHGMQTFATADDWSYEVDRCNCNDSWRLCLANEQYKLSSRYYIFLGMGISLLTFLFLAVYLKPL